MSLTATLSNALSGLNAATKSTELISSNISNALSPHYGKRTLDVSTRQGDHGGVSIDAIQRQENKTVLANLRVSTSQLTHDQTYASFAAEISRLMGTATSEHSVASSLNTFRNTLIEAAGAPNDPQRLARAVGAADQFAQTIAHAAKGVVAYRTQIEKSIQTTVKSTNQTLVALKRINSEISHVAQKTGQLAGLLDQRDALLSDLSKNIEFKIYPRENGQIALYSKNGHALVDGRAAQIQTTQNPDTGQINFVFQNDPDASIDSGHLGALANVYNIQSRDALDTLNHLTNDVVEQFFNVDPDPTLDVEQMGIFTTGSTGDATGFSIRTDLTLAPWKLRDGLGAPAEAGLPDNALLNKMAHLLETNSPLSQAARSLVTQNEAAAASADQNVARSQAAHYELSLLSQQNGVNTDHEMQQLLVIEQAYAANAKIIEIVETLFAQLMRIGT